MTSLDLTLATNRHARDVPELLRGVQEASGAAIYFHTHHFLMQHQHLSPEPTNDFSEWLKNAHGETHLADAIARLDAYTHTLEGLRRQIVRLVQRRVAEREAA